MRRPVGARASASARARVVPGAEGYEDVDVEVDDEVEPALSPDFSRSNFFGVDLGAAGVVRVLVESFFIGCVLCSRSLGVSADQKMMAHERPSYSRARPRKALS